MFNKPAFLIFPVFVYNMEMRLEGHMCCDMRRVEFQWGQKQKEGVVEAAGTGFFRCLDLSI